MTNGLAVIQTGDIIEFAYQGELRTGMVLLSNDLAAIIDLCDDTTPVVIVHEDLVDVRVYSPLDVAA
jgi:hypothetical protein